MIPHETIAFVDYKDLEGKVPKKVFDAIHESLYYQDHVNIHLYRENGSGEVFDAIKLLVSQNLLPNVNIVRIGVRRA